MGWPSISAALNPAFAAAVALVAIQVGIGIVFKIAQKGGEYEFSTSGSIAISESLKGLLSTLFFYRECQRRKASSETPYQSPLSDSERSLFDKEEVDHDVELSSLSDASTLEEGVEHPGHRTASYHHLPSLKEFWISCTTEVPTETKYGFAQLALLYTYINNTIFIAYKLADPGTISLMKSGVTLITALVMLVGLGTRIAKVQWVAIILQICGLMVTQYHPGTGAAYPLTTYLLLMTQTFISASSGVYNQQLCKSHDASLHADNQILYASGACINLVIHVILRIVKPDEPSLFSGYNSWGAIMVVLANVFIGLAITAVYKYADAVIKCFATAVSTGILLYISPILFGTEMSFLVIPGTLVVFVSTWLYVESAPPKDAKTISQPLIKATLFGSDESEKQKPWKRRFGLAVATVITFVIVVTLSLAEAQLPDRQSEIDVDASLTEGLNETMLVTLESPFKNTLGWIRFNSEFKQRLPLVMHYAPFFKRLHISMPHSIETFDSQNFANYSVDNYENSATPYKALADTMQIILDAPKNSSKAAIEGILMFHFDVWVDPLAFGDENFNDMWFPGNDRADPPFRCMDDLAVYPNWAWWGTGTHERAKDAARDVVESGRDFKVDPKEWCIGWSDLAYVPRRFFEDFIYLANVFLAHDVYHESAYPTILHIIDQSRRAHRSVPVLSQVGDCWGSCCTSNPSERDILWNRCGHHMDYREESQWKPHYDRLAVETAQLGDEIPIQRPNHTMSDIDVDVSRRRDRKM